MKDVTFVGFLFLVIVCVFAAFSFTIIKHSEDKLLNMSNTISPILSHLAEQLCGFDNIQFGEGPARGGSLIYKREPCESCISGIGNVYYIRYYEWWWTDGNLYKKPIEDIPLDCYSCIPEKDVLIPYFDKQLQDAELGKTYCIKQKKD